MEKQGDARVDKFNSNDDIIEFLKEASEGYYKGEPLCQMKNLII